MMQGRTAALLTMLLRRAARDMPEPLELVEIPVVLIAFVFFRCFFRPVKIYPKNTLKTVENIIDTKTISCYTTITEQPIAQKRTVHPAQHNETSRNYKQYIYFCSGKT